MRAASTPTIGFDQERVGTSQGLNVRMLESMWTSEGAGERLSACQGPSDGVACGGSASLRADGGVDR